MAYVTTFVVRLLTGIVSLQECATCHAMVLNTSQAMLEHVQVLHEPFAT